MGKVFGNVEKIFTNYANAIALDEKHIKIFLSSHLRSLYELIVILEGEISMLEYCRLRRSQAWGSFYSMSPASP